MAVPPYFDRSAERDHEVPRADSRAIIFESFRLDSRAGRLMRGDDAVALRPKTWSVLVYLAERPGVLVTKGELLNAVWGDVSVTESVLSKSIGELRAALDDSVKTPRLIETVPRRGFRFIAPTTDGVSVTPLPERGPSRNALLSPPLASFAAASATPFVGRAEELEGLAACLAKARGGERQVVFITGPAGIGKTALVGALLGSGAGREAAPAVGRGVCVQQHGPREAYMPVLEALEGLALHGDAGRLRGLLRRVAPTWLAQIPWLIGEDEGAFRQSLQIVRPERMLREFAILIEALATDVTVVLVLEDLHWSDASTVDLLSALAQRDEPARLLVIGTFRSADAIAGQHVLMKTVRTLSVRRRSAWVPLSDLSEEEVRHYLRARFPDSDFPPALARRIHEHTDGNPLFMIGVVEHMRSRGYILDTEPGWALSVPLARIDLGVSDDVRLLIDDELEGLSPADRSLLQAASVAGDDFTAVVVAAALGCDADDVESRCEAFTRAQRFLRLAGHVEWPGGAAARRYAFVHELYRQAVYAQIAEQQCMRLHQRIGQALEAAYGARRVEIAPQLATHFVRSHDDPRALRYLIATAERARLRFASREAMEGLRDALVLVQRRPEDDDRRRQELGIRLRLGAALSDVHGFASEQVRENYERAAELCSVVGTPVQLFAVSYARWYLHAMRAERDEALALAAQLEKVARRLGAAQHRIVAASASVRTAAYDGRFTDAQRIMQRRLARTRTTSRTVLPAFGPEPVTVASTHFALVLWFLGHPARARNIASVAVRRARELGHFLTVCAVLVQAALVELLCRNTGTGRELAEEAISLSVEHGFTFWRTLASVVRGWALVQQGEASEGCAAIRAELIAMEAMGTRLFLDFAYAFLAEGHLRARAFAEGLTAVEAGLALGATSLNRPYAPELWHLKGKLLAGQSELEEPLPEARSPKSHRRGREAAARAEACFQRALHLARASKARSLEIRAATSLARVWQRSGRGAEAGRLLGRVSNCFGAGSESADLVEARALMRDLARR